MLRRIAVGLFTSAALLAATPAAAQGYAFPIDIRAQPLSSALRDLARQTGVELLFDRDLVRGMQAPRIKSRLTVEASLRQLLGDTGLTMRRASSGAWVIERRRAAPAPAPAPYPARTPVDLPIAEILVTAKRSQNADIQRRENDVQPYQVISGEEIAHAHRDNLDQFFRSRVTGNTQIIPPSLDDMGQTNSQIDLRGLGIEGTMILVDGRRLPRVPNSSTGMGQPDLNALPLYAIDRIETLTGTAGGIYGFGALGGVVNVVLKRDYRGAELHATTGLSARGDAARLNLEGRTGFTPDDGRTDIMLELGWSDEQPLLVGQRDYAQKHREVGFQFDPDNSLIGSPRVNGIIAVNYLNYDPLTLKPEYGGATLNSLAAFLPLGFSGGPAELAAMLTQNGGKPDFSLTDAEARSQLGSNAQTFSAIGSLRHDFGSGIEGYFDALYLRNRGRHFSYASFGDVVMAPSAPQNPFDNYVQVTFPASPEDQRSRTTLESARLTAGLLVPLPHDWSGTLEATLGYASYERLSGTDHAYFGPIFLFGYPDDDPQFTPFGNWDEFRDAIAGYNIDAHAAERGRNRYREQSVRLAGPLFTLGDTPTTLTLQAQARQERAPRYSLSLENNEDPDMNGTDVSSRSIDEGSLYAELRAPVFREDTAVPLLKGLELQFAVRYDHQKFVFAADPYDPADSYIFEKRFSGAAYTAGAKFHPLPWLMVRGSYATGVQPQPINQLMPYELESSRLFLLDPKRGNDFFTDDGDYLESIGGNPDLKMAKASTISFGAVLNPFGEGGPRFSLDFSRVNKTGDPFSPSDSYILEHEDVFPERVIREPLTDEDRALGYTGGRILVLDSSTMNAANTTIETLDALFDWTFPALGGSLHAYAAGTLQIGNKETDPITAGFQRAGYFGHPLKWRANGGFDLAFGPTSFGANLQFFSHYHIDPEPNYCQCIFPNYAQGSPWVKSQVYMDLYATRRFRIGGLDASLDLGIVNVLDQSQPYELSDFWKFSGNSGYSMYGDPRRRRFELVLSAEF